MRYLTILLAACSLDTLPGGEPGSDAELVGLGLADDGGVSRGTGWSAEDVPVCGPEPEDREAWTLREYGNPGGPAFHVRVNAPGNSSATPDCGLCGYRPDDGGTYERCRGWADVRRFEPAQMCVFCHLAGCPAWVLDLADWVRQTDVESECPPQSGS